MNNEGVCPVDADNAQSPGNIRPAHLSLRIIINERETHIRECNTLKGSI